jgi:hypothetical protein
MKTGIGFSPAEMDVMLEITLAAGNTTSQTDGKSDGSSSKKNGQSKYGANVMPDYILNKNGITKTEQYNEKGKLTGYILTMPFGDKILTGNIKASDVKMVMGRRVIMNSVLAKALFADTAGYTNTAQMIMAATLFMHQEGDKFNSPADAAIAFGMRYGYAQSRDHIPEALDNKTTGQEYGAVIVKGSGGTYSFENVIWSAMKKDRAGKVDTRSTPVDIEGFFDVAQGSTIVGIIHSHPTNQDRFSVSRKRTKTSEPFTGDSTVFLDYPKIYGQPYMTTAYLVTKNGKVLEWNTANEVEQAEIIYEKRW